MIPGTVDLFSSIVPVALPRLGDTPYALMSASARIAGGLASSWDNTVPVVYVGDGSQTQAAQNGSGSATAPAETPSITSAIGGAFKSALSHTLLGAAGIVLLGVGAFVLLRGD